MPNDRRRRSQRDGMGALGALIERVEAKVDEHARESMANATQLREFVGPALRDLPAKIERVVDSINQVSQRLDRLDRTVERLDQHVASVSARATGAEQAVHELEDRVRALETRNAATDAADRRQARIISAARVGVVTLVAIASFLVSYLMH